MSSSALPRRRFTVRVSHWAFEYSATVAAEKAEHAFTSQIEHSVPLR
ncbi:hypothetical protein JNB63_03900 [Microbacterium trichothecenolyticum]|nr:hypothetical protein [Microbacterium trichothecenolyticum]MBW9119228.1 hypothetical protein [Microbacterium trichothecenolyticum]